MKTATLNSYPGITDLVNNDTLDFDRIRHDLILDSNYTPSIRRKDDLEEHLDMLKHEFTGQHKIKFVHAALNVLLRRSISSSVVFSHFEELWSLNAGLLLEILDIRWLVSACDSIATHSPDMADRQIAILISLYANTLKLYETERSMLHETTIDLSQAPRGNVPLFEGMTGFVVGYGDMPANLLARIDMILNPATITGLIAREIVSRTLACDTVYLRFLDHQKTNQWRSFLTPKF